MADITDRVALVTGAGSLEGIGFAIGRALQKAGAKVCITATTDRIFDRAAELGCLGLKADLTDPAQVQGLFALIAAQLGPVAVLVNNAGMVQSGKSVKRAKLGGLSDADWAHHMALNIGATFHCIRAALPAMQAAGFGRIVNIGSVTEGLWSRSRVRQAMPRQRRLLAG